MHNMKTGREKGEVRKNDEKSRKLSR
ncbi:hypothetical protein [Plasmodium yoelii yoelii]|uniref:Uncharacterized protein n=1 Tax=Plasmodium yoelii yoelii TaxID=73239 RepID=Q7RSQ6_PLAYO|nr:hypothetical protein [Plasmodium yoelii yoelii]